MTPTTDAGRDLHAMTTSELLRDLIPIIEQEAAAAERARIIAAISAPDFPGVYGYGNPMVEYAAVLAAIRGEP